MRTKLHCKNKPFNQKDSKENKPNKNIIHGGQTSNTSENRRRKRSSSDLQPASPQTPSRFEELPQAILNRLTPIKDTTSNFLKEWEKSLSSPPQTVALDGGLQDFTENSAQ